MSTLPLRDIPRLASAPVSAQDPIQVQYCTECSTFDTTFASYRTLSSTILSEAGQTLFPDATLPIISTANWGDLNEDYSQIGGLPSWIQDAEYPSCPECNTTMRYFAQFALSTLDPSEEGIYYMFVCSACQISASSYQQS